MTSENMSLADKFKNHRTIINRTLWTGYVALPFMAAYSILGVIMSISRSVNYAEIYNQTPEVLRLEKLRDTSNIIGMEGISWIFAVLIAVLFALQGFSYIFNQSQLDFYLSQPTTRAQRIRRNYFNAITTYLALYIICEAAALIVAAGLGAVNGYVILSALIATLVNFIIFFAFYNMTVLAVVLSGTLPIAVILTGVFMFVPLIMAGEVRVYKSMFYATYSDIEPFSVYLSPVADIFKPMVYLGNNLRSNDALSSALYIQRAVKVLVPSALDTLLVAVIAFIFVLIFAKARQSEWVGKSIPLRPFRWLVKIVACVVVGLASGFFVHAIYSEAWNNRQCIMMLVVMVLATIITGCITEVILEGNIRKFFKGIAQTIMALALVVLVFVICKGDLLGYDSYIPANSQIVSGALVDDFYNTFTSSYPRFSEYSADHSRMVITNVDDLVKIAEAGMKNRRESAKDNEKGIYENRGYDVTVLFRLKSGKNVYRSITIPFDVVDDSLERIVSSEEFIKGNFDVFDDDEIRQSDAAGTGHMLRYVNPLDQRNEYTEDFSYAEISDAYRKDLLENFRFSYVKENMPVANIEYEQTGEKYLYGNLEVYENYTNTIELMKKYGIYSDTVLDPEEVKEIQVTNYYPGYDLETTPYEEVDPNVPSVTETYADRESIDKIMDAVVFSGFYNPWYNYNKINDQYSIEILRNTDYSMYGGVYCSFRTGKVPDFVTEDTN